MQKIQNLKVNYYFDEAGDTSILGHHGLNLLEKELPAKLLW